MSHIDPRGDRKFASEFLFIMKDLHSDYKSKDSICVFDRHGFYSLADIYSSKEFGNPEYRTIELENILFDGKDGTIDELSRETGEWINQHYLFTSYTLFNKLYDYERWW